jgi:cytidylate kinase
MEEVRKRTEHAHKPTTVGTRLGPYLTVSREEGTGGSEIARMVGRELGWEVLDSELLDFMAERHHLSRDLLRFVDETTSNWLHEAFNRLMNRDVISQQSYVHRLHSIILLAARHGNVIFVGRGAHFLLPPQGGLVVRIVAPEKYRIEQVMREQGIGYEAAKKIVEEKERGRHDFISRQFHRDPADPHLYDLVINSAKCGLEATADVIVCAVRRWLKHVERGG